MLSWKLPWTSSPLLLWLCHRWSGRFVGLGASSNTNPESLAWSELPGGGFCEQVLPQQQEQVQHSRTSADLTQLTAGQKGQTENNQKQKSQQTILQETSMISETITSPLGPPMWCSPAQREGRGLRQELLGEIPWPTLGRRSELVAATVPLAFASTNLREPGNREKLFPKHCSSRLKRDGGMLSRRWRQLRHTEEAVRQLLRWVYGPAGHGGTERKRNHKEYTEPCPAPGFLRVQSEAVSTPPRVTCSPGPGFAPGCSAHL